jgi:hypothetical protein
MPFTCVCCCCALHMCQCLASYSIDDWEECLGCRTSRRKDPWGFSAGESGLTCRASCLEHCLANSGIPLPGRVRMAAEMATCTHLLAVSCGFERFIHIWCLASETTLEGAEVDRCGRHRQHAAGTPGFTVLAAQHLPPPDDRRRRLAVCFVHVSVSRATPMSRNGPCLTPCIPEEWRDKNGSGPSARTCHSGRLGPAAN